MVQGANYICRVSEDREMQIGELAKQAGVNTQTIRFYERRGLIKTPARTQSGYRAYSDSSVQVVRFIKQSKKLGYTLAEIKQLINLHDEDGNTAHAKDLALSKIEAINKQISDLKQMRKNLSELVANCGCGSKAQPDCIGIKELDFTAANPKQKEK